MKNSVKLWSSAVLLVVFGFALTSFVSAPKADPGNGTIVEVQKDVVWRYVTVCDGEVVEVFSESATTQIKNGEVHVRTLIFRLPPDHCSNGDKIQKFNIGTFNVIITPGGMLIAKQVFN